ncbi:MAG: carbon-nitrogen hydrolase family protein [Devosiaceae bacterium]|nr:carbon-nitrogen hydrolase family protein [Devosiaceae bacterium]
MSKNLIIAAAQMCSGISPEKNIEEISNLAKQAAAKGARYLLTPEMSVAFAENFDQLADIAFPYVNNEALIRCSAIAKENNLFLHIGSLAIVVVDKDQQSEKPIFANRSVLFNRKGEIVDFYDKIHLFDAELAGERPYRESRHYVGGDRLVVAKTDLAQIGMSICYDLRFGALYRKLAHGGAQIISVPAAFTVPTGRDHWEILLRARAIETGCYIVASAQGGKHENGRSTYGYSMIIDPWGKIISQIAGDESGIVTAKIDLEKIEQVRAAVPALKNSAINNIDLTNI